MSRARAFFSTTVARLSAIYLVLFGLCAVTLIFYMNAQSSRFFLDQTKTAIEQEADELIKIYQRSGLYGLGRVIERRSYNPNANLYLMSDGAGNLLTGNVAKVDNAMFSKEGWTKKPFEYQRFSDGMPQKKHQAVAQIIMLPNGMRILLGRDVGELERLQNSVDRSLKIALLMMCLGAILIWFFVGRRALKRMENMSSASQRIMNGDLSGRLPVLQTGDEFDRLAQNLNQMLEKIAALNEGLKQVSDNIAHDLKTPLTRLRARAELALTQTMTPEIKSSFEDILKQSDGLIAIFNSILMISRLEAGYSSENMARVDLNVILNDVIELYDPLTEEAGMQINFTPIEPVYIMGNRELLSQIFANLIDNALKYANSSAKANLIITINQAQEKLEVIFKDNGPGIAEQDRERVVERFVRLEKSRTIQGSGLGLSLVKAVMQFHKGSVSLGGDHTGLIITLLFPKSGAHL